MVIKLKKLITVVVLVFFPQYALGSGSNSETSVTAVASQQAIKTQFGETRAFSCEVVAQPNIIISSKVNAELVNISSIGTVLNYGDTVFKQDDFYILNSLQKTRVTLKRSENNLAYYQNEYDRAIKQSGIISSADIDSLKWQWESSISEFEFQKLEEAKLQRDLLLSTFKADGKYEVSEHLAGVGQYLLQGDPIAILTPLEDKELKCSVPLSEVEFLRSDVSFYYENLNIQKSRERHVINNRSQSLDVYFSIPAIKRTIYIGQRVTIHAKEVSDNNYKIHPDAIVRMLDSKNYIWIITHENSVRKLEVEITEGTRELDSVVVNVLENDITIDQVVTNGADQLSEGTFVTISNNK